MKTICLVNGTIHTGITSLKESSIILSEGKILEVLTNKRFLKRKIPKDAIIYDISGAHISPGFIDSHIHGICGYGTEDKNIDSILKMSSALSEYGVTSFCPTIYPESHEEMILSIKAITGAIGSEEGAKIIGIHMEGPFISREKRGVQLVENIQDVNIDRMEEYWEASKGHISNMTVAPELNGMRELALYCNKKGIVLQAGHSNACYREMLEGIQAGIIHSTHLFNAMRPLHHRDPGVTGSILIHPEVSCEIIADGIHVHPALIKLLLKEKPLDKIVLVTDSLKTTNQSDGDLIANGEEVYLDEGIFKRKSDNVIAGSALTMLDGIKNLFNSEISLESALQMASGNPAIVLGLQKSIGTLLPGKEADITVFDDKFNILKTFVAGKLVWDIEN